MAKTTTSQLRASRKWQQKNKEHMARIRAKSAVKKYVLTANADELLIVKEWIKQRETELKTSEQQ